MPQRLVIRFLFTIFTMVSQSCHGTLESGRACSGEEVVMKLPTNPANADRLSPGHHPVKRARYMKGWTAYQLAQQVGVNVNTIYQWEKGRLPHPEKLRKLAETLGRDWRNLLEELVSWRSAHR